MIIGSVIAGHTGEAEKDDWFNRVCTLRAEYHQVSVAVQIQALGIELIVIT